MREGIDPLNIADKAVQAFADLVPEETGVMKQAAQGLSDLVPSRDDVNEQIADVPVLGQLGAASEGIMSAPTLPVAIAGRVANQDISFYDTPTVYKDTWAGDAVFKISQAIAAAYMTRGVVPGGGSAGLVGNALGEGAIESVPIRAAEDIPFWGPELAQGMGEIANGLGYDGGAFTRDLIEGRSPGAQATNAVFGFMQNSLMIAGSDALFRKIFKNAKGKSAEPEAPQNVKDTARVTNQSESATRNKLDNQTEPIPDPWAEPSDVKDIDTSVGVTQPREGSRVSFEAPLARALKRNRYYDETIPAADNNYFLNLKTITDDAGYTQILNDITRPLRRLRDFPQDLGRVMNNLAPQMDSIKELMGLDRYDDVAKLLVDEGFIDRRAIEGSIPMTKRADGAYVLDSSKKLLQSVMREYGVANAEGMMAISLIGQEMAERLKRVAMVAMQAGDELDLTPVYQNFVELSDKANMFLIPMRRGKRKWAIDGYSQQRNIIKAFQEGFDDKLRNLDDTSFSRSSKNKTEVQSPGREFEDIRANPEDEGNTVAELWARAQAGDEDAMNSFKEYVALIASADTRAVLNQQVAMKGALLRQLRNGTSAAGRSLRYASWLTGMDPLLAAGVGNYIQNFTQPLGTMISAGKRGAKAMLKPAANKEIRLARAEYMRGQGQLLGAFAEVTRSLGVVAKSFKEGQIYAIGNKFDNSGASLAARGQQLDLLWEQVKKQNPNPTSARERVLPYIDYLIQKQALIPLQYYATRGLTALDDGGTYLLAASRAVGDGYAESALKGVPVDQAISKSLKKTFEGGDKTKQIIDSQILGASRQIAFNAPIPRPENPGLNPLGQMERLFSGMEGFSKDADWAQMFLPFVRIGWNLFDFGVTGLAGSMPYFGRKLLTQHKRYKRILEGGEGAVKKQMMEANIAFSQLTAMSTMTFAWHGGMTGNNESDPKMRQKIIIPWDNREGRILIPYDRLPWAMQWSFLADLSQGIRDSRFLDGADSVISDMAPELLASLGLATLDQTYNQGLIEMTQFLDFKRLGTDSGRRDAASNLIDLMAIYNLGAFASLPRQIAKMAQPYKTIDSVSETEDQAFIKSMWSSLRQRHLGGIGNPLEYDIYTSRRVPKAYDPASGKESSRMAAIVGASLDYFGFPGNVRFEDKVPDYMDKMDFWGFKFNKRTGLKNVDGVSLTADEQSIMQQEIGTVGQLDADLKKFFAGKTSFKYKRVLARFEQIKGSLSGPEYEEAQQIIESVNRQLMAIHRRAKDRTFQYGSLQDTDLPRRIREVQQVSDAGPMNSPDLSKTGLIAAWGQGGATIEQINNA